MTSLAVDRAAGAAGHISRRWFTLRPKAWLFACDLVRVHRMGLLDAIDGVYREIRDDVAREAFDRQEPDWLIARRRRRELALELGRVLPIEAISTYGASALDGRDRRRVERRSPQLCAIIDLNAQSARIGGELRLP